MAKEKPTTQINTGGIATHKGVLFQTLATWALALDFLRIDPKTLKLSYEPPTGGDMLFTLDGGNNIVFCQAKYRSTDPSTSEIKAWFKELYSDHAEEIESTDSEVTLVVVTTLKPGSKLYRAAANLRHRPSYLRGKLKISEEDIPFDCKLQLINLPHEVEAISAKTCWGLIGLLGIPLDSKNVEQVLSGLSDQMVIDRSSSGGTLESVQALIIDPLFKTAEDTLALLEAAEEGSEEGQTEHLRNYLQLQQDGNIQATTAVRNKLNKDSRLVVDVIDYCRDNPGNAKEALLSLVGNMHTEFTLFKELKGLVPSHISWTEALDIIEAALLAASEDFTQQLALELLQDADVSDPVIKERVLKIAADTLIARAGTEDSNDAVLEAIGELFLALLPHLPDKMKRKIVEDIFATCSQLLTDHSWYHFGTADALYKVAKQLTLESFDNFSWFITVLTDAHKERGIYHHIPYRGYEDIGHGASSIGTSYSTGDYSYALQILFPAIKKYYHDKPKGWEKMWSNIGSDTINADNPVWLKRAAIPVLLENLTGKEDEVDHATKTLVGYTQINHGIPSLSEMIFERLVGSASSITPSKKLELLDADIHSVGCDGVIYPYPHSIYGFQVLFELCVIKDDVIRKKAHELVREFLNCKHTSVEQVEDLRQFTDKIGILISHSEGIALMNEVFAAFLENVDRYIAKESYENPTSNIIDILIRMFRDHPAEAHELVKSLLDKSKPYGKRILACVIDRLACGDQKNPELFEELFKEYADILEPEARDRCEASYVGTVAQEIPDQTGQAYEACTRILKENIKNADKHNERYQHMDKQMQQSRNQICTIDGAEGSCLFSLHRMIEQNPQEAYEIAKKYWLESSSCYLRRMAGCYTLRRAIHFIAIDDEEKYDPMKGRKILEELLGEGLSTVAEEPYTFPGMWDAISNIAFALRDTLNYEEVQVLLKIAEGRDDCQWILPQYAFYHEGSIGNKLMPWSSDDLKKIREQCNEQLIKGDEEYVAHVLNGFRNVVHKGGGGKLEAEVIEYIYSNREKRHYRIIDGIILVLTEAAKKKNKEFLSTITPFFEKCLIPFVKDIPENAGYFYMPGCDQILEWLNEEDSKQASQLAKKLLDLRPDLQHKLFRNLDLNTLI